MHKVGKTLNIAKFTLCQLKGIDCEVMKRKKKKIGGFGRFDFFVFKEKGQEVFPFISFKASSIYSLFT